MKIKRKKTGTPLNPSYDLVDAKTGRLIADAVMTGERGRDDYPWNWSLAEGLEFADPGVRTLGTTDSLSAAVDIIETRIGQYGLATKDRR